MIAHKCGHRGCNKYIDINKRYCDEHAKLHTWKRKTGNAKKAEDKHYNQFKRDEESNTFYHSKQWVKLRDLVFLNDMATCQVCGDAVEDRKIIDHIHALKVSPDEKLDPDNLWCLCYRCHNIKTKIEQSILAKTNGKNKLKHISKDNWVKYIKERM